MNRGYAKGGRAGYFAGSLVKNIPKLLKKLGTEIKAQPLPPKLQKTLDEVKKLQKLQKPGVKKAAGGRAGYAVGGIAAAQLKGASNLYKKYKRKKKLAKDTKKGKFPETESVTHQKGPYVGDVGSEKSGTKRIKWEKPERPGPKRPEWKQMPIPRPEWKPGLKPDWKREKAFAEGGRIGLKKGSNKKWIQSAVKGMVKTKPCTGKKFGSKSCPPGSKRYNLAKTFKKMGRERKAKG